MFFQRPPQIYFFRIVNAVVTAIQATGVLFVCCFAVIGMELREAFLPQLTVIILKLVCVCIIGQLLPHHLHQNSTVPCNTVLFAVISHIQPTTQEGTM